MKILDSKIAAKLKFVTLFAVSYLDRTGKIRQWHMAGRGDLPKSLTCGRLRPDAVIIAPYHRAEEKLVVIREYRVPVGDYLYGFPAGLLDPDEEPAAAAARELREETGLELIRIYRHTPPLFSSAGITDETVAVVYAEVAGTPTIRHNSDSEEIEILMLDRPSVYDLLRRSDIVFSARAWLVMDAFARMGPPYFEG